MPAAELAGRIRTAGVNLSVTTAEHNQLDTEIRPVHPLVRLSPHYYNTEAELERVVDVVKQIATSGRASAAGG